jgi:hypothetical protein
VITHKRNVRRGESRSASGDEHERKRKPEVFVSSSVLVATALRSLRCRFLALALLLTSCSTSLPCPAEDLGGWIVDDESTYGVHHYCTSESERFVLRAVAKRRLDGSVAEWTHLATLDIPLRRGERTMFGFECGSRPGRRGDAIAVVRYRRDGSFAVKRACLVHAHNRTFVAVPAHKIACESLE